MLLLVAAADPQGDPALLWRAASDLGIGFDAAAPAEREGLVSIGARVAFRHPLVRSAIYRTAPVADRQNVHRALAGATDAARDPDRRAWHRAQSASGPNAVSRSCLVTAGPPTASSMPAAVQAAASAFDARSVTTCS